MGMDNFSLADIKAVTEGNDDNGGMGGNSMWIIVLFLFMFMGRGGGLFGGGDAANGALTRAELNEGLMNNNVERKLDSLGNGLCDGFYAQNTTMLQGFNGLQGSMCQGFNNVGQQIVESRYAADKCCCETNRNIDSLRYEAAKNTCDITTAIRCDGDATRALINANTMQELRDQLQAAQLTLSNAAQTQNLVSELRPCAKPAYITCSPYTAHNSCGCA